MVQVEIFIMSWVCILMFMSKKFGCCCDSAKYEKVFLGLLLHWFVVLLGDKELDHSSRSRTNESKKERTLFMVYTLMGHFNTWNEKWGINRGNFVERNEGGRKWEKILRVGTYSVKISRVGRSLGESCETSINKTGSFLLTEITTMPGCNCKSPKILQDLDPIWVRLQFYVYHDKPLQNEFVVGNPNT